MSEQQIQDSRIKEFDKFLTMYKEKVSISRLTKKLGFGDKSELEDWLFDLELPGLLIALEEDAIYFTPDSIKSLRKKYSSLVQTPKAQITRI